MFDTGTVSDSVVSKHADLNRKTPRERKPCADTLEQR